MLTVTPDSMTLVSGRATSSLLKRFGVRSVPSRPRYLPVDNKNHDMKVSYPDRDADEP